VLSRQPTPAHEHAAQAHLAQALQQAQAALLRANPNPRVGCVLVNPRGDVIGQGSTQQTGGPHAEVMALRNAQALGHATAGATAYVTLEPCSHHGRTGPCCDALIHAGITHVVAALPDPNPLVAGQGFARLRAAGVAVDIASDSADPALRDWAAAARELNIGFFSRMLRRTPWVRLKTAASVDGVTALPNGQSQWITGEAARADGHAWRARACAVLTGIGTVLQDRPRLDVRGIETPRQPALVIVDSDLQTPPDAPLFTPLLTPRRPVLIYAATQHAARQAALERSGATVVYLPEASAPDAARPKVDLAAMLRDLALREMNEIHVEAGHKLNGSLLRSGLVDELLVYLAPLWLGTGAGMSNWGPLTQLADGLALEFQSAQMVGADLRVLARVAGRGVF
jgi:diaminohydroxyphosphoribosylaminopyrimidine deaminase / 5-amino-6-(5-phosphoribosylamino)uracil reductase